MKATLPEITDEKIQYETIDMLRFPLICLVVLVHSAPVSVSVTTTGLPLLSDYELLNFFIELIGHALTNVAVPAFCVFSGYLFFLNFREWSWRAYGHKLRRRVHSLLLPYLAWNTLALVLIALVSLAHDIRHGLPADNIISLLSDPGWHIYYDAITIDGPFAGNEAFGAPIDLTLWFVRDLIVTVILTPIIHFVVRRTSAFLPILLLVMAYIKFPFMTRHINVVVPAYFTAGAFFAIHGIDMTELSAKARRYAVPASIGLMLILTFAGSYHTDAGMALTAPTILVTIVAITGIARHLTVMRGIRADRTLVASCFFIYALHTLPPYSVTGYVGGLVYRLIPPEAAWVTYIDFPLSVAITVLFCLGIYIALRRIWPTAAAFLTGMR